eukprot:TRINITY_DN5264_c0_g1_i1.p1 TRINITY_DN5264_c0_g1~~TRINITY_DN5264_c0_g1_i1.p1  ORF type:complete len:713 (-),score=179.16 TRINITY_DN5264_c0_g1_i1:43-2181(-)
MPELSEIHLYSKLINANCEGQTFRRVSRSSTFQKCPVPTIPWSEFKITSKPRGKELQLIISPAKPVDGVNSSPILLTFAHGLVGGWAWCSSHDLPDHAHLMFHTNSNILCYYDAQKMGSWKESTWGADRGPDPVLEFKAFVANILDNLSRPVFDKEICEVLLEQKWFNGIGNYLRAEAMFRAAISPFVKARTIFAKTPKNFDFSKITPTSDKGAILLFLCRQIPLEVITQDMNKYGNEDQKKRFHDWLRIYDKGTQVRKNGRAVHYSPSQLMEGVVKVDLGSQILDVSGGAAAFSTAAPAPASTATASSNFSAASSVSPATASSTSSSGISTAQVTQMLPLVIGKKPTPAAFSAALASGATREVSPLDIAHDVNLPPEAKLLVLIAQARRSARMSPEQHKLIKMRILADDPAVYSALEVYETDQDFEDFLDTAKRLAASNIVVVQRQPAAQAPLAIASSAPVSFASASSSSVTVAATAPAKAVPAGSGLLASLTEPGWTAALKDEFQKPYWSKLASFVESEYKKTTVYPPKHLIFNAFNSCPLDKVKVVILGQDPYINENQAHGLCFSVQHGVAPPPSLVNIYKELATDIAGFSRPDHGCLQKWADQGVFMLNALLTVREKTPMSHAKQGWEDFTSRVIEVINERCDGVVFMLWGMPAQQKAKNVQEGKHLVLKASHPSPLSAHTGWFGCKHFSKANEWLSSKGKPTIDWKL